MRTSGPRTYGHVRAKERPVWLLFVARGLKVFYLFIFLHVRPRTYGHVLIPQNLELHHWDRLTCELKWLFNFRPSDTEPMEWTPELPGDSKLIMSWFGGDLEAICCERLTTGWKFLVFLREWCSCLWKDLEIGEKLMSVEEHMWRCSAPLKDWRYGGKRQIKEVGSIDERIEDCRNAGKHLASNWGW